MYNSFKKFNNKIYTGMRIGNSHHWNYTNGKWYETKKEPDKWNFTFESLKTRINPAPINSGADINTQFHWYIIADQIATKIDNNSYMTSMNGIKFKIGHKRPYWRTFSYNYPNQIGYKEKVIEILERILFELKNK
ncbi:MAG: hypothetical protein ACFE9Q_01675 [Candidatus Hodarchaeota archaeon]